MKLIKVCISVCLLNTAVSLNSSCLNCACCIDTVCSQDSNTHSCTYGCQAGHWGTECWHDCPSRCATCSRDSGHCVDCRTGYHNPYSNCSEICPTNCNQCISNDNCLSCKDGYHSGYYKDEQLATEYYDCRYECRENCLRCYSYKNCDYVQCMEGFASRKCDYCSPTYYGALCNFKCENCKDGECGRTDGVCTQGCNFGYNGDTCRGVVNFIVAISILSVALGIVLAAVSVFGVRKLVGRHRRVRPSNINKGIEENNDQHVDRKSRGQIINVTSMKKSAVYQPQVADNETYNDSDDGS